MSVKNKGPWMHRCLVWLFTVVLGVLVYWLLGFVVDDIGRLPGPDYTALEEQKLDQTLVRRSHDLAKQIEDTQREINDQQTRQRILRDSTNNSQTTMNQLLELQRLSLQKGVTPTDAEREALTESEQLFLDNQRKYQVLNEELARLNESLRELEGKQRAAEKQLEISRRPVRDEFQRLYERHRHWVGMLKLAVLIPLLLIGVGLYLKFRSGTYGVLIYAVGIPVVVKVGFVMHAHFPGPYYKYVLILFTLAIALRVLVYLLRMVAFPKQDWLVKQYREAYEAFLCPICSHPIRRGPLKFMSWTRRSIRRLMIPSSSGDTADEPYTCPACSTPLYEACDGCGNIRHTLLPACEKCGAVKPVERPTGQES
jgi:hypothetical protein